MNALTTDLDLTGQVAIVTGAGRGIGLATARRLAAAGASVLITDLDGEAAHAGAATVNGDTAVRVGDITAAGEPEAVVQTAIDSFGRLDIVVNNAGYDWDVALVDMTNEQWDAMIAIHATAPFQLLRAAGPHLISGSQADRDAGTPRNRKVINMSSVAGTMGEPWQANYASGKAALLGLTKGLAREWAVHQINVNAVAPGIIDTRLTQLDEGEQSIRIGGRTLPLGLPEDRRHALTDNVAFGRPGRADEVASVVCFLATPASDYVHGQVVSVTGGLLMGMTS